MANQERAAALLRDLERDIVSVLTENVGLDADVAAQAAAEISDRLSQSWGKQYVYIPCDMPRRISERDRRIWAAFNGHNHHELARRFSINLVWVYAILRRMKAAQKHQMALDLPLNREA